MMATITKHISKSAVYAGFCAAVLFMTSPLHAAVSFSPDDVQTSASGLQSIVVDTPEGHIAIEGRYLCDAIPRPSVDPVKPMRSYLAGEVGVKNPPVVFAENIHEAKADLVPVIFSTSPQAFDCGTLLIDTNVSVDNASSLSLGSIRPAGVLGSFTKMSGGNTSGLLLSAILSLGMLSAAPLVIHRMRRTA